MMQKNAMGVARNFHWRGPKKNRIGSDTPWAIKKGATFIFTITLANVDRLQ